MKRIIIFFLSLIVFQSAIAQLKEYNVVESIPNKLNTKTTIIYICATWCSPCMAKLKPIIDSFGNNTNYDLVILFDRDGYTKKNNEKLKIKFDVQRFFRFIPNKYYPQKEPFITVNPVRKVIKKFTKDFNAYFNTNFKPLDDISIGHAIVFKNDQVYVTKAIDKTKTIEEIKTQLSN